MATEMTDFGYNKPMTTTLTAMDKGLNHRIPIRDTTTSRPITSTKQTKAMMDSTRFRSMSVLIDNYFNQDDGEDLTPFTSPSGMTLLSDSSLDSHHDLSEERMTKREYKWQFRHTVSYWIAVWYTFGGILFVIGNVADIYKDSLNESDYYTLNSVAFFVGGIANLIAGFWGYHQVINEPTRRNLKQRRIWCMPWNKSPYFWASFIFLMANIITLIPKIFAVIGMEFVR